MKRIEAVIPRAALNDFHRCAKELGIFGFDLSAPKTAFCHHQRRINPPESRPGPALMLKIDFAVLDDQANPTVHAVLKSVHPESIGIFRFDEDMKPGSSNRERPALLR